MIYEKEASSDFKYLQVGQKGNFSVIHLVDTRTYPENAVFLGSNHKAA